MTAPRCNANPPGLNTWNGATPAGMFCHLPAGHPGDHRNAGVRDHNWPDFWVYPPETWPRWHNQ